MAKRQRSPCIDVCEFSGPKRWCIGCGRTRKECRDWYGMKPSARLALERELRKRLSRIEAEGTK